MVSISLPQSIVHFCISLSNQALPEPFFGGSGGFLHSFSVNMECCTKKAVENHVEFVEKRQAARSHLPRAGGQWPPLQAGPLKLRAFPYPDPSLKQAANSWRTLCAATGGGTAGLLQFFSGFVRRGTCSLGKAVICLIG